MKGYWPISKPYVRRCRAFFESPYPTVSVPEPRFCGRLIWPWQDVVREYDPECGGALVHHACHHRSTEYLWRADYGDRWTEWLSCEHTTDRLVSQ